MNEPVVLHSNARRWLLLGLMLSGAAALIGRAVYLQQQQLVDLQFEGKRRFESVVSSAAHRGAITDRNGEVLAVSAPVDAVLVTPKKLLPYLTPDVAARLAKILDLDVDELRQRLLERTGRTEYFLQRQLTPNMTAKIKQIRVPVEINNQWHMRPLPGLWFKRDYQRYYPMAEVTSHLVGFAGVENVGLSGMEYAKDDTLKGIEGETLVVLANNRSRDVVDELEVLVAAKDGEDLVLSIDRRVQYLAYRELKAAVQAHGASAASAVLLDVKTGEILAIVNQPTFNPNSKKGRSDFSSHANRAVTETFEPGSTVKPFTIAAALDAGVISPKSIIETNRTLRVGHKTIRDAGNYGAIDPRTILMKSSNVGVSKVALAMTAEDLWKFYSKLGFGLNAGSHFPAEADGFLGDYWQWQAAQQAAFSYGYGLSVTALQLARAYSVLANDGILKPISLEKLDANEVIEGERVMSAEVARSVRGMLESVVADVGGTGKAAQVKDYRISGKTGTVHVNSKSGGYESNRYKALFAGIAPASDPRLVLVVVVHDPRREKWHGGAVAAPVFSKIMAGALRLLNVAPDNLSPTLREVNMALPPSRSLARVVNEGGRG